MNNCKLDFLIIGAQKSGTTTLFKILSEHPLIYMPEGKEAPFFTNDAVYKNGLSSYTKAFFAKALPTQLWGTATPHYLNDPRAAKRIVTTTPNIKLIAILREPADRALSHYRMSVRRGLESRSFEQAISEMLKTSNIDKARLLLTGRESEALTYLAWGEYPRLLKQYLNHFPRENILILFTDDLKEQPKDVIQQILDFLELPQHNFTTLGKRFHEGGTQERIPLIKTIIKSLKKTPLIKNIWFKFPLNTRGRIMYAINQLNTVKSSDSLDNYDKQLINKLKKHYQPDIQQLEKITRKKTPWERTL